jgi:hypothetical protein
MRASYVPLPAVTTGDEGTTVLVALGATRVPLPHVAPRRAIPQHGKLPGAVTYMLNRTL